MLFAKTCHLIARAARVNDTAFPYIAATRPHDDAGHLLATFGTLAADEAAARAEQSRRVGNHLHFCRWRQVGRLIATLGATGATGTVH